MKIRLYEAANRAEILTDDGENVTSKLGVGKITVVSDPKRTSRNDVPLTRVILECWPEFVEIDTKVVEMVGGKLPDELRDRIEASRKDRSSA